MPTFRHPASVKLVLHDGEKIWAQSEDGVLELNAADAKRFRASADQYGFVEDPPKRAAAKGDGAKGDTGDADSGDGDADGAADPAKD
jgi:hypothetical protein